MCPYIDGLVVCHLPHGPTASFSLSNTVMRHDLPEVGTMSEAFPHLIFHNFKTNLGLRVMMYIHSICVVLYMQHSMYVCVHLVCDDQGTVYIVYYTDELLGMCVSCCLYFGRLRIF